MFAWMTSSPITLSVNGEKFTCEVHSSIVATSLKNIKKLLWRMKVVYLSY